MKRKPYLVGAVILTTLLAIVFLALSVSSASAARSLSTVLSTTAKDVSSPPMDYLIALPVISPNPMEVPPHLSPEQAIAYARGLTYRQARPVLAELERLQAEGKIAGFEVRPDLHGVLVRGGLSEVPEQLSRLRDIAAVAPFEEGNPPPCAATAAEALAEQVEGLSRVAADAFAGLRATGVTSLQSTDPSVDAYVWEGTWSYVSGRTTPDTEVAMRILRGGRVIATGSTTSSDSGDYYFYPSWQSCPTSGYDWTLRPGDVVEVTAHGNTVSTVVATLSAWVDPETDVVAGRTDSGRSVEVRVYAYGGDPCSSTVYERTVGTDGSGNFSVDFTSQVDFDRRASATVYARDGNGNSTYTWFYAYRITAEFNSDWFNGSLKPEVSFTAVLSRGGSIVSTYNGTSDSRGYYYGWFTDTIRAGDIIQVSGGDVSMEYTATDLDVTLDPTADQATGTTGAGRTVKAYFYKRTWWGYVWTGCSWNGDCASTTADGSGAFTLSTDLDLVRGDYANFYVYDAEGNYQYAWERPVPAIVADLSSNQVEGYWGDPNAGYVTVTLKNSSGTVKETDSWIGVSSWDGEFDTWMSSDIAPTDIIEVTDGVVTETMTVQNLTARLDGGTGHLTGNAPSGHLVAALWDFRRDERYSYGYCSEADVAGSYNLTFNGAQVGGQDYADVWSSGPDGHYTHRWDHAFTVNVEKESDNIDGYTETPFTPVTVTLQRGGSPVAVYTTTSSADGYYGGSLSGGTPVTITQGDAVQVQTGDGDSVTVSVPELTVNADAANNRVYGKSPANDLVQPEVRRHYNWGLRVSSQIIAADTSGNYSASFNDLYWSRDCSAIDVGHRCIQPAVRYYNSAGHQIWLEGPSPQPVEADIYESDNISTTARTYAGIQSHTFHATTDTDWITFTVSQADVDNGVSYRIETFNLGWGMATRLKLYATDGTTLLIEWTGYEYHGRGASALWTPSTAGTYYLEVSPPSSSYAAYCDAVYDLMIMPVRAQVYLPLVMRGY